MLANGYHERLNLHQYKVGLAIKQRLKESGGTRVLLTMKVDGSQILVTRLHQHHDIADDRFILSSQSRFSWGARDIQHFGICMMRNITWKRVITILDTYQGDVRLLENTYA